MARTLILLIVFFVSSKASAQNEQLLRQINDSSFLAIAGLETILIKDSLSLTSQQLTGVDSVNRKYFAGIVNMQHSGLDPDQRSLKLSELNSELLLSLTAILTVSQYEKYLGMMENRRRGRSVSNNQ